MFLGQGAPSLCSKPMSGDVAAVIQELAWPSQTHNVRPDRILVGSPSSGRSAAGLRPDRVPYSLPIWRVRISMQSVELPSCHAYPPAGESQRAREETRPVIPV